MQNSKLWKRVESFDLDDETSIFPFIERLIRENGWTAAYASRVAYEYKRFAYLTTISKTPVTPSDDIDQAWHLHLVYTKNYWGEFCKTLGMPLHHGPTKGGNAEEHKYKIQYRHTLDLYEDEFGDKAPSDIWPDVAIRFANADQYFRINAADYWLVPKPKNIKDWVKIISVALAIFLFACSVQTYSDLIYHFNTAQLSSILILIFILIFLCIRASKNNKKDNKGCAGGCSGCGGCGG